MSNYLDKLKLSGTTYDLVDSTALHELDSTVTSDGANAVKGSGIYNAITASTAAVAEAVAEQMSGKTDTSAFTAHTSDTVIHTTQAEKNAWNAKVDDADIADFFDGAVYEMSGETHVINFYHGNTIKATINAEDFIADGMIDDVRIETLSGTTYLVIDFNTASGKEDILIPLTDIFDPSNYMTSAQTVSAITEAVSGKQDTLIEGTGIDITDNTISVTGIPNVDQTVISGSTNPVAGGAVYTELQGKQATLVSGTNIKTVGNESVLGSGNIKLMTASIGTGNDSTTLIFDFN